MNNAINQNVEPELYNDNDTDVSSSSENNSSSTSKNRILRNNIKTRKPSKTWRLFRKKNANSSNRWMSFYEMYEMMI